MKGYFGLLFLLQLCIQQVFAKAIGDVVADDGAVRSRSKREINSKFHGYIRWRMQKFNLLMLVPS